MGICYKVLPSTFVPDEDQGVFMASITMPEGRIDYRQVQ